MRMISALGILGAVLVLGAAPAAQAQTCWDCVFRTGVGVFCDGGDRGNHCTIDCQNGRCKCKTTGPCPVLQPVLQDDTDASTESVRGSAIETCKGQVRASMIEVVGNQIRSGDSFPVQLGGEQEKLLAERLELLSFVLKEAAAAGGVLVDEQSSGIVAPASHAATMDDVYSYVQSVRIEGSHAILDFSLENHPELVRVQAEIWDKGNSGRAALTHKDGTMTLETWSSEHSRSDLVLKK